jgi:hypothetical protein
MTSRVIPMNSTARVIPMNSSWSGEDWANLINVIAQTGTSIYNQQAANKAAQLNQQYQLAMQQLNNAANAHQAQMAQLELERLRAQAELEAARAAAASGAQPRSHSGNWWANRSTVEKGLIIGGSALAVGGIIYLATRKRKKSR